MIKHSKPNMIYLIANRVKGIYHLPNLIYRVLIKKYIYNQITVLIKTKKKKLLINVTQIAIR
jgi:hypothetical protein